MKKKTGGNVLASGGYGCVFSPALKCKGSTKREKGKITKLQTERHAQEEYEEIMELKEKLDTIKNYKDYFLVYDINICKPAKLTKSDLTEYHEKCKALPKRKITEKNINEKLDEILSLNIPNGGLDVEDFLYHDGSFEKVYSLNVSLLKLLKEGIVPMNKMHIYHGDIKESNVLVDSSSKELKSRLIDWGLTCEFIPSKTQNIPKTWTNRPFQYNVPFSVIIFTEYFIEKYTNYIKEGGTTDEAQLKPFVIDYIKFWLEKRGRGHYKFINDMMYTFFSKNFKTISSENKAKVIESQITMEYIVNYIVNVLVHFTKFSKDGNLDLRYYLETVFIKISDVWGFICIYYPIAELLYNNYTNLNKFELNVFNKIKYIFINYLYNPRHEPIDMDLLYMDLQDLGRLINLTVNFNKTKIRSILHSKNASGININAHKKTKKNINSKKSLISFKRKTRRKRFKTPFLLSLK